MNEQRGDGLTQVVAAMMSEAPVAPTFDELQSYEPDQQRRIRFPALAAACAVVIVALVVGVIALVGRDGTQRPGKTTTRPPATTAVGDAGSRCGKKAGVWACVTVGGAFALKVSGLQPDSTFELSFTAANNSKGGGPVTLHADNAGSFPGDTGALVGVIGTDKVSKATINGISAAGQPVTITVPVGAGALHSKTERSNAEQPQPCLALAGGSTSGGTINVHDVATQQTFAMSVADYCRQAEALRPPKGAPLVMENYVANGRVGATYYRTKNIEQTQPDGSVVETTGSDSTPLSQAEADAIMDQYRR